MLIRRSLLLSYCGDREAQQTHQGQGSFFIGLPKSNAAYNAVIYEFDQDVWRRTFFRVIARTPRPGAVPSRRAAIKRRYAATPIRHRGDNVPN